MVLQRYTQTDIKGKKALLRLDLDVDGNSLRLERGSATIKELLDLGAERIVVLGHRGRPDSAKATSGKPATEFSLEPVKDRLELLLNKAGVQQKIELISDIEAPGGTQGQLVMLENLRFWPGEKAGDGAFAKILASWGEVYINDAFSNSHRADASMVALPEIIKNKFAGPNLLNEINELDKFIKQLGSPFILILGGIKISDKLPLIKKFINRADAVLLGGGLANTILKIRGVAVGQSVVEDEMMEAAKALHQDNIFVPEDFVVRTKNSQIAILEPTGIGEEDFILDIGPKTIASYIDKIKDAQSVLWNGPMGKFEDKEASEGTMKIVQALASSRAQTLAGGGETVLALEKNNLISKIGFVSAGGGAMLYYLAGETMPALEALK